ncbi:MAG: nickel pincer cofactor biosynthesis protein LarB [Akkermansia sp.]
MNQDTDLGFAKLDLSRRERTGMGETIYCAGKTSEQLLAILRRFGEQGIADVLGTRCSAEQYRFLCERGVEAAYDPLSRVLRVGQGEAPRLRGTIALCTGGTADLPVAEEAARTAQFLGAVVERFVDVGVAGLHRLLSRIDAIRRARVVIAVAGMEGALPSVLSGLVPAPVIAVPTSVGYGASFGGVAALLAMLNSCAEGVSVVNIDNGFGAAVQACRILSQNYE